MKHTATKLLMGRWQPWSKWMRPKALKNLGMWLIDEPGVENAALSDSYEDVTMSEYAPAPEVEYAE